LSIETIITRTYKKKKMEKKNQKKNSPLSILYKLVIKKKEKRFGM
jgi:hypothetical protein